ncbi:MAG: acylneuraminate cytidylyltransferase family protein [Polaribacter sp.]
MKVIAIIPARGGSEGITRKNLVNFRGKALMQWSIEAALQSEFITDVVVSSDDDEILQEAGKNKEVICLKRPIDLALSSSRTEPVLTHALENIKEKYNYLVLLQPTSPLRNFEDINAAFSLMKTSKADSLISVCNVNHHPFKSFVINKGGFLEGLIDNNLPFMPRQGFPKAYRSNGAIYIIKTQDFLKTKKLITNNTIPFEMTEEKSLDIDTKEDLNFKG